MRKSAFPLVFALALLAGCVTINVYFPAAAAKQAADKIIGNIIGPAPAASAPAPSPATSAAPPSSSSGGFDWARPLAMRVLNAFIPVANAAQPNLQIRTPAISTIEARMRARYRSSLEPLLDSGVIGFARNGDVAIHDVSKIPLARRTEVKQVVAAENADRAKLYKQLAIANGHPEWATRMREAFAKRWTAMAHSGWYYQDTAGHWKRK